jgi:coatomer protein complex subunit alpha (xenin)
MWLSFSGEGDEEEGWEMEDLELPAELAVADVVPTSSAYFVVPPSGIPTGQAWVQTSSLAGEHAAAGSFDTAMRLLNRQLGIKNFEPLRSVFLELHLASHTFLPTMVSLPVLPLALERGWSETTSPNARGLPALVYRLSSLEEKLKVAYKTTTEGKFTEALRYGPTYNLLCNQLTFNGLQENQYPGSLDNGTACKICHDYIFPRMQAVHQYIAHHSSGSG